MAGYVNGPLIGAVDKKSRLNLMDVLKDLHLSIAETCEASFNSAYRDLESRISSLKRRAEEAEKNAAAATSAQQTLESRNQELQSHVSALQEQLEQFESRPQDLELPKQFDNLEDEFAPEQVLASGHDDDGEWKKTIMKKYSALYSNLQIVTQGWGDLKAKVLQHKKKLRHWDKQLQRDEFTLVLNGRPVTFRRARNSNENIDTNNTKTVPSTPLIDNQAVSFQSTSTTTNPHQDVPANVKIEAESQPINLGDQVPEAVSPDTLPPLPDIKSRKRRRVLPTNGSHPTENVSHKPVAIKNEPLSSSPSRNSIHSVGQHFPSTQDLDNIGLTVETPKKRKSQRELDHGHQPDEEHTPTHVHRERADDQTLRDPFILNPIDGNCRPGNISVSEPEGKKRKVRSERESPPRIEGKADEKHDSQTNNRLLSPKARKGKWKTNSDIMATSSKDNRRQLTQTQSDETEQDSCPQIRPEDEPYRARPLDRLDLSHFKINPDYNQGMDYAYNTVVRKKDERKCLSGCTRPGCCGDRFRAMARLGGLPSKNSKEQQRDDDKLLEEYLGDERHTLDELNTEDRERLLIEAKARTIANQYGRHRHAHQRPRTPPGFWRTEMPSTQDLEADWEAASHFERDKIEDRYREAMRPGGLWIFADE
ncbi:hypothetical protein PENSTE_c024G10445 [Penicillium steckii]|uniref:DNA endonuclease activator Ctp1 C-terminal domain-containing protein n=1 Tax=Penicillium steckii TaxID=303698 RepID=A0A1V6SS06_9EURO|nr:hypothetical protein PENSTE_c024G10445 [Penicillium steckii]